MKIEQYFEMTLPSRAWIVRLIMICCIGSLCFTAQAQKKKSGTKGAKKSHKNQVETRPDKDKIRKKAKKEQQAKNPGRTKEINPLSPRRKGVSRYESEQKLHTKRVEGRRNQLALPNVNPVEWKIPQNRNGSKLDHQVRKHQGGIKQPVLQHPRQIGLKHSREIMNFSGKLSIAKPGNSRKQYFKVSREIALFQGNMKVKWLHYHHRHPSLWRMGRNERPSSREVYINRKMAKKPKYNPKEREIWDKPRAVPKATVPEEKEGTEEE